MTQLYRRFNSSIGCNIVVGRAFLSRKDDKVINDRRAIMLYSVRRRTCVSLLHSPEALEALEAASDGLNDCAVVNISKIQ